MAKSSGSFTNTWNIIDDLEDKGPDSKIIKMSEIVKMASIGCTTLEIATAFGCSKDTLERRAHAALEKGRAKCKISIKRNLFKLMEQGSVPAAIWLSKNFCDMSDSVQVDYTKLDLNKLKEDAHTILKELENEATH